MTDVAAAAIDAPPSCSCAVHGCASPTIRLLRQQLTDTNRELRELFMDSVGVPSDRASRSTFVRRYRGPWTAAAVRACHERVAAKAPGTALRSRPRAPEFLP